MICTLIDFVSFFFPEVYFITRLAHVVGGQQSGPSFKVHSPYSDYTVYRIVYNFKTFGEQYNT